MKLSTLTQENASDLIDYLKTVGYSDIELSGDLLAEVIINEMLVNLDDANNSSFMSFFDYSSDEQKQISQGLKNAEIYGIILTKLSDTLHNFYKFDDEDLGKDSGAISTEYDPYPTRDFKSDLDKIRTKLLEAGYESYTPGEVGYIYSEKECMLLTTNAAYDIYGKGAKNVESIGNVIKLSYLYDFGVPTKTDYNQNIYLVIKTTNIKKDYWEIKEITDIEKFLSIDYVSQDTETDEDFESAEDRERDLWNTPKYVSDLISSRYGKVNSYIGSADWGGIPVWSVGGNDLFEGFFIGIDDNSEVFFLERTLTDEETIDNQLSSASNTKELLELFDFADEYVANNKHIYLDQFISGEATFDADFDAYDADNEVDENEETYSEYYKNEIEDGDLVLDEDEDEDEDSWFYSNIKKLITDRLGKENSYSGSADWGGIPVWSVGGNDLYTGYFVGIDDEQEVFFMHREFDEEEEENIDKVIFAANDVTTLNNLFDFVDNFDFTEFEQKVD